MALRYLKEIPLLPDNLPLSDRTGFVVTYQDLITSVYKDYRVPDARLFELLQDKLHKFLEIPAQAFADPENPTTVEVRVWAMNSINVSIQDRNFALLGYSRPSDSSFIDFTYVWMVIDKREIVGNPIEVILLEKPLTLDTSSNTESITTVAITNSVTLTAGTLKENNVVSDVGAVTIAITLPNPTTLGLLPGSTKSYTFKRANDYDGGAITLVGNVDGANFTFPPTNRTSVTIFVYDNKYYNK